MLKKAALAAVAVVVLLVVVGLALPRTWHVERAVVIDAPSARIHPYLNDLRRWQEWAAWNKELDPQVRNTWEGPQDGVGSKWAWMGPQMGRGSMEIVASDPAVGLTVAEAIESDEVNAKGVFTYAPVGASTRVTWLDEGTLPPVIGGYFRAMVEEQLGGHFDKGLQKLKATVEALPPPPPNVAPVPVPRAQAPDAGDTDDAGVAEEAGAPAPVDAGP